MSDDRAACDEYGGYEDETIRNNIPDEMHLCPACYMDYIKADPDDYEAWVIREV